MARSKTEEEKRRRKTELQRLRRMKIRNNAEEYEKLKMKERERWNKRVQLGKIKQINDLSRRDQKAKRALWAGSSKKYREKLEKRNAAERRFMEDITPPASPQIENNNPNNIRRLLGRKKVRKDRAKAYRTISRLRSELQTLKRQHSKYKSKYFRLKKQLKRDSPNSKVNDLLKDCKVPPVVKRKLIFHEALTSQISTNLLDLKSKADRIKARQLLTGNVIKKYKCLGKLQFLTYKEQQNLMPYRKRHRSVELIKKVRQFSNRDESSPMCPGKKDTITKGGMKKQKRLLNKSLKYLHRDFMMETGCQISYSFFCQVRPFWIVQPNLNKRDTCLCTTCENVELLVKKLKVLLIINQPTSEMLYKSICCEEITELCLERKCECVDKKIVFNPYVSEEEVMYWKWLARTEAVLIKGKEKLCKKIGKAKVRCTKKEMTETIMALFPRFMQHIANKNHQYQTIRNIKANLKQNEILLHMDFSENYVCKYHREIQSMHFGGSKEQVVLHTLVAYYKMEDKIVHQSFCTVSECPRKDPLAILAHLKPIVESFIAIIPNVTKVHFLSDGRSTQYRNFKMFYLFGMELPNFFPNTLMTLTWNYSEKGHGKGAPDGIGGVLKRTADNLIALGEDIPTARHFVDALKRNIKKTKIIYVSSEQVNNSNIVLPGKIKRFKGALQTHQITWTRNYNKIHFRRLTCIDCDESKACQHCDSGLLELEDQMPKHDERLAYYDVYSSSEDEDDEDNLPLAQYLKKTVFDVNINDYLLVKFTGKKSIRHYIGCVKNVISCNSFEVKFLRLRKNKYFVFPDVDDIAVIDRRDLEEKLDTTTIDKRGHHIFKNILFSRYKYLS